MMKPRDAELLLLRSDDFSYEELAAMLGLNPVSVGTLIARARRAFRKEYVTLYGEPREVTRAPMTNGSTIVCRA